MVLRLPPTIFLDCVSERLHECKLDRDSRFLALLPGIPLAQRLLWCIPYIPSELNMRFDVTACACGIDQYSNSIYNTDYLLCVYSRYMIIVIFFYKSNCESSQIRNYYKWTIWFNTHFYFPFYENVILNFSFCFYWGA